MTLDTLLDSLKAAKPGFVPFQPYVSGMTKAESPISHDDPCLNAAIQVYFGDLDGAHDQLQSLEYLEEASYLHGIIHRREGDFFNANYWFNRAPSVSQQIQINPKQLTSLVQSGEVDDQLVMNEWINLVAFRLKMLSERK